MRVGGRSIGDDREERERLRREHLPIELQESPLAIKPQGRAAVSGVLHQDGFPRGVVLRRRVIVSRCIGPGEDSAIGIGLHARVGSQMQDESVTNAERVAGVGGFAAPSKLFIRESSPLRRAVLASRSQLAR